MNEPFQRSNSSRGRPLHVAMVIQRFRPDFSGHGVQVEELCKALAHRGVTASIVTTAPRDELVGEEERDGYRVQRLRGAVPARLPAFLAGRLRSPVFAARTLKTLWGWRGRFDLIHVHALTDALYPAWLVARRFHVPIVFEMTLVGNDDPIAIRDSPNLLSGLRSWIFRRCDGYVAISPALASRYHEAGLARERVRVIPQGVDLARFRPVADRPAARRMFDLPPGAPVLAFVGSLIERKGIDVLLAAWSLVHSALPQTHLLLVGRDEFPDDPGARRHLERALAALDPAAAAHLHRTGVRDDTERALRAADLFLFPSRREGFGSAIIEAMACGLPCIVAELPGISDFIFAAPARAWPSSAGEADGIVVPQEDPKAIAQATIALLSGPDRAAAIGKAARARVEARFGFDSITQAYLEFYAELLDRRNR
jgi:glycosyltransferase involved in cell wall biosynthesis